MNYSKAQLWDRFQKYYTEFPSIELALDFSRMNFDEGFISSMKPKIEKAFRAMEELEKGAIANSDEKRMVGHYWLRNPSLAPHAEIRRDIETTVQAIKSFAERVHKGQLKGAHGEFKNLLVIGIGGSALGPQFVAHALGYPATDKLRVCFFDNTDPDGMDRVLASIEAELGRTLCVVISKSGGTKETRNGMLEAKAAFQSRGLRFEFHAVAVTGKGSELDKVAQGDRWLARFPMWDWVGGRTSETSAVGLLPAALQGFDIDSILAGAKACDQVTRQHTIEANPAAQLALMWHYIGGGKGAKNMVVLPYKDRLELFSKYLQQLVMESLGKKLVDANGSITNQGMTVYGNKGSTDQHAYVQQLRDGIENFFVMFVEVLKDRNTPSIAVEPSVTSGDYLSGFLLGTRNALYESNRESITITIGRVDAFSVGVLIALFERAVGLYASLINVNPYHQPGVEAGKKAAGAVISIQNRVLEYLDKKKGYSMTSAQIASGIGANDECETVFKVCEHLSANPDRNVIKIRGATPFAARYQKAEL